MVLPVNSFACQLLGQGFPVPDAASPSTGDRLLRRSAGRSGWIGDGSCESPSSHRSTAAAQERPSAIAQTISDWPATHVAADEHAVGIGHPVGVARDVAALVERRPRGR